MEHIPIIAVFGSTDIAHKEIAEAIGAELARRKCIVLSGKGPKGADAVKDWVMADAETSGCCIHVENAIQEGAGWKIDTATAGKRVCKVQANIGHKRNYLEACLCDAAIAIEGGEGTDSEAAFCILLGKPVVFVGKSWVAKLEEKDCKKLLTSCQIAWARKTDQQPPVGSPFDELMATLNEHLVKAKEAHLSKQMAISEGASRIVQEVLDLCTAAGNTGRFPELKAKEPSGYSIARKRYEEWLLRARKNLASRPEKKVE